MTGKECEIVVRAVRQRLEGVAVCFGDVGCHAVDPPVDAGTVRERSGCLARAPAPRPHAARLGLLAAGTGTGVRRVVRGGVDAGPRRYGGRDGACFVTANLDARLVRRYRERGRPISLGGGCFAVGEVRSADATEGRRRCLPGGVRGGYSPGTSRRRL